MKPELFLLPMAIYQIISNRHRPFWCIIKRQQRPSWPVLRGGITCEEVCDQPTLSQLRQSCKTVVKD